ncbi:MHYT domain-containing protein [Microbulbifer guangxiensis]|uniref:MHYT domain-containing protein n=1 Tax=Microbulbifer guangxiensis TaxID=2904249 RepID=UPI001F31E31B|nr:MHYT domain-containing protein [Microbulbifer guangxiensis]
MHYGGMAAMLMPAEIRYDLNIIIISVVIAVVAAGAALWMAFQMRGRWQKFGSALIMGVAVCGMHYTGMAAATYKMTFEAPVAGFAGALGGEYLGAASVVIAIMVLVLNVWVARWYRQRPVIPT